MQFRIYDTSTRKVLDWYQVDEILSTIENGIRRLCSNLRSCESCNLWPIAVCAAYRVAFIIHEGGLPLAALHLMAFRNSWLISTTISASEAPERAAAMLMDFDPHVCVTMGLQAKLQHALDATVPRCVFVDYNRLLEHCEQVVCDEFRDQEISHIYFTSGSTGRPKGCVLSRDSLISYAKAKNELLRVTEQSGVLLCSSPNFDPFFTDVIATYVAGAMLILGPVSVVVGEFASVVIDTKATHSLTTPVVVDRILPQQVEQIAQSLQVLALGGEAMSSTMVQSWSSKVILINIYGVTECCGYQMAAIFDDEKCNRRWLGSPFGENRIMFDMHGTPCSFEQVPEGTTCELLIGGPQVGIGYLNLEEMSRKRFINSKYGRLYSTGDFVQVRNNEVLLMGRKDNQVKLNGVRVQLDEIENAIQKELSELWPISIVTFSGQHLVAWLLQDSDDSVTAATLRKLFRLLLSGCLQYFMIPHHIVTLQKLPQTPSGKVDRKALVKMTDTCICHDCEDNTLSSSWEQLIAKAFSYVLGVSIEGKGADFLLVGGDSLKAVSVVQFIRKQIQQPPEQNEDTSSLSLGKELEAPFLPHLLLENSTVERYALLCESRLGPLTKENNSPATQPLVHRPTLAMSLWNSCFLSAVSDKCHRVASFLVRHLRDDSDLFAALIVAVGHGMQSVIDDIVNVNHRVALQTTPSRQTLLHIAAQSNKIDVYKALFKLGLDATKLDENRQSCLHTAARHGCGRRIISAIMSHSPPTLLDTRDQWGRTALHWAVDNAHRDAVNELLSAGADPTVKDNDAETPRGIAERRAQCRAADRPRNTRPSTFGDIAALLGGSGKTVRLANA